MNEQALATGIVEQAVRDWKRECAEPIDPDAKDFDKKISERLRRFNELRRFFQGKWCDTLICDTIRPEKILAALESEYEQSPSKKQIDEL
jgi:hypothetical protein